MLKTAAALESLPTHDKGNDSHSPLANQTGSLLNRTEAAKYLNVSPATLAVWACSGRQSLPFVKLGRAVRYRLSDLDAFIESRVISY